ncbi:hypothetical protein [Fangia hongkongensis]|uniref:hypothetical protein n=1 Tax=Fangia hongkongensis TaxID=270495 RepID=UPI000370C8EF|nr:hypothetical protein [Fangia hongkongensis]MBK2125734.1 hypothetical protein [Fangia hongkongensis]
MTKKSPLSGIKLPNNDSTEQPKKTALGRKPKKKVIDKKVPSPRSYRISYNELDMLRDKAESVSEMVGSNIKITDTLILRSLIRLSEKISNDDIIEEIKLIRMEI